MPALTDKGFLRPSYKELLAALTEKAKQVFGEDIDTDGKTLLGKFLRIIAQDRANDYEDMENVYYGHFVNTARGISLDRLCALGGLSRNPATRAVYTVSFTGTAGYEIPAGFEVCTPENIRFYTEDPVLLSEDGTAQADVTCTEPGTAGNIKAGSITEIVNPDANVESVSGAILKELGQDTETDTELRARFRLTIAGSGSATVDAIRAEIMRVPNVTGCVIEENDTETTDSAGRPGHSFECFVLAPEEQNQQIAQAIFDKKPIGIKSVGDITVPVLDKGGFSHDIRFSKVEEVPLWIKVSVKVNSYFEQDGEEQIKTNLAEHINALPNGKDVVLSSLYSYIFKVTGVEEVSQLLISTDGSSYEAKNIVCSSAQAARTVLKNIEAEAERYVDL